MEIKATCKFDYETMRAFYFMYKAKRVILYAIFYAILELLIIVNMLIFGVDIFLVSLVIAYPIIFLLTCLLSFAGSKRYYNSLGNMKDVETEYTFYDDGFHAVSSIEGMNGESNIKYSMIEKVIEKPEYIYMFQTKQRTMIVDKSTITGGTVDDLRNKLMPILQKKYYCKCK